MDRQKLLEAFRLRAVQMGTSVEEAVVDEVADLKTSARDSIIRGIIFGFFAGLVLGAMLF